MKRLLPLLALGLLAGCVVYPDYGYYNDGRGYDRYQESGGYYPDGGDYYGGDYYYDDGAYGYGPYSSGYGYGYGDGYGGWLGYGYGSYPYFSIGFSSGYGGYYPYGGYYGGYYPYGGYYGHHHSHRRSHHRDRHDRDDHGGRGQDSAHDARWPGGHNDSSPGRDGAIDPDASSLADQIARERGTRDATPRNYSWGTQAGGTQSVRQYRADPARGNDSRARDTGDANKEAGWRSDYRDAQLASPRAAASGGVYARPAPYGTRSRFDAAQPRDAGPGQPQYREQSTRRAQPVQVWRGQDSRDARGWSNGREAQPRFESGPRQSYAAPRAESAPQRFSQPSPQPRAEQPRSESRGDGGGSRGNSSRERDVGDAH